MTRLAILQARMTSSRLPGKVMLEINHRPMIYWQIQRILQAKSIDKLIVATSDHLSDNILADYLNSEGVLVFRGSLSDVHSRFLAIVNSNPEADTFLRLTADCPLVMPHLISDMLTEFDEGGYDYLSNCFNPTYPDGLDIEIFSRESFLEMSNGDLSKLEKEHVTLKYRSLADLFRVGEKLHFENLSNMRWTVDYEQDYEFVKSIFKNFQGLESTFSLEDVLELLRSKPELNTQLPGTLRNIALQDGEPDFT